MKTVISPAFILALTHIAVAASFLPLLTVWRRKIAGEKSFLVLGIYWLVNGIINIPSLLHETKALLVVEDKITLFDNLLDGPLVMLIFYFSATGLRKRLIKYAIGLLLIFDVIMTTWKGFNYDSSTIIVGVSTVLSLACSISGLIAFFTQMEHTDFEQSMLYINVSLLFFYGLFIVIYIFNYLLFTKETIPENMVVYLASVLLSVLIGLIGLFRYNRSTDDSGIQGRTLHHSSSSS